MPTYQYACTECAHALEAQQSFTDDPLTTCPECSGRLRKVFSAVGVVFKGSGFYRNDSRSDAAAAAASSSDSGTKGDSSDSGSTTTKADKGADSTSGKGAEKKSTPATSATSSSGTSSGSAA